MSILRASLVFCTSVLLPFPPAKQNLKDEVRESVQNMRNSFSTLESCVSDSEFRQLMRDLTLESTLPDIEDAISSGIDQLDELLKQIDAYDDNNLIDVKSFLDGNENDPLRKPPVKGLMKLCEMLAGENESGVDSENDEVSLNDDIFNQTDDEVKEEIKERQKKQLSSLGFNDASTILLMVEEEWKAYKVLKSSEYLKHRNIIEDQVKDLKDLGMFDWTIVKVMVDENIKAAKALENF